MNKSIFAWSVILPFTAMGCANMTDSGPATAEIVVKADQPGAKIDNKMWGVFFEDINFGGDGGLYAELVKNRAFEFDEPMMGWTKLAVGMAKVEYKIQTDNPYKAVSPHYLRIASEGNSVVGVTNEGFRGMGMIKGDLYDFSTQIRLIDGNPKVKVQLIDSDGAPIAEKYIENIGKNWSKAELTLSPKATDPKCRMNIMVEGKGTIDLDFVSLFPQKTWKNRKGGLRADMVQALADLKPGFVRFPGGCIVEGSYMWGRYQWKNTIGPVEDRKLLLDRWNNEFTHRPTPDYYQSFGVGFYEFFLLAEDLGAQPLPILNCGMSCQFSAAELVKLDELQPYVQDALDLIEFANGPATSEWGAKRAAMGHPAPFNMKMIGVGNEQWGPQFFERFDVIAKAIKAKYPEIKIVSGAGPSGEDERFAYAWPELEKRKAEIVDQHCYASPIWFLNNANRYDNYDRKGPKVFFGEYAAQTDYVCSTKNRNNWETAISEAALMTGLERNGDVVTMASYAPLFSNIDAWQWTPDLIWVNNFNVMKTPNYMVQQMYMLNAGDQIIPATNNAKVKEILPKGKIGLGAMQAKAEFEDIQVTRGTQTLLSEATLTGQATTRDWFYNMANPGTQDITFMGNPQWSDYTLTLKARKTEGNGAIVVTVCEDPETGSYVNWVIGGWENKQNAIITHYALQDQFIGTAPGSIENNKWYDVKVVMQGSKMDCYLDGKLVQSADVLHIKLPELYTSATKDAKTGELILKVVNPGAQQTNAAIKLSGVSKVSSGEATVLSGKLADENSFENPTKLAPKTQKIDGAGPSFNYTFKPYSFTVLRLKAE